MKSSLVINLREIVYIIYASWFIIVYSKFISEVQIK